MESGAAPTPAVPADPVPAAPADGQGPAAVDIEALLEPYLAAALDALTGPAPLLSGMAGYHLGRLDEHLSPAPESVRRTSQGKRLRPGVALLCCAAAGGDPAAAAPVAAAIELLHNFTLIHDDIQDESRFRRHRRTVWSIWGGGQAINAGDALFAAAQLALYRVRDVGAPAELALRLAEAFARMTIEIVQGQVLDLSFEGRGDVTPDAYLEMIALKTAAIVRFAAWSGALLGGADDDRAERFAGFGRALGLGFQVRDDLLGIWGTPEATGKPAADDLRRRKQTLPIIILRARADGPTRAELDALFANATMPESGVVCILELLAAHGVAGAVEERVRALHAEAGDALIAASPEPSSARETLVSLVESMAVRDR
jgi:geranylgeranyl diphosphate synthase type I